MTTTLTEGVSDYLNSPLNPMPGSFPWGSASRQISLRIDDDFWLHHLLKTKTSIYRPSIALEGDMVLEIVDRRYVFTDFAFSEGKGLPKLSPWNEHASRDPDMSLEIEGWERGKDAVVRPLYDIINFRDPNMNEIAKAMEVEWLTARKNAVGLLRVNVSLAIRNAFDAVHEHRTNAGAQFDWTATSKPKPGRYDGCDLKGWPLDPEHPSNRDLPPEERAARRDEIEAFINARDKRGGTDTS